MNKFQYKSLQTKSYEELLLVISELGKFGDTKDVMVGYGFLPNELKELFIKDKNIKVRKGMSKRSDLTLEQYLYLTEDENSEVSKIAQIQLLIQILNEKNPDEDYAELKNICIKNIEQGYEEDFDLEALIAGGIDNFPEQEIDDEGNVLFR